MEVLDTLTPQGRKGVKVKVWLGRWTCQNPGRGRERVQCDKREDTTNRS